MTATSSRTPIGYGTEDAAMQAYLREGERKAFELDNRGPIRLDANGKLAKDILGSYWKNGFYVFEGVVNVVLSIALITRFGLVGVAVGTIIPHMIVVAAVLPSTLPRWIPINLREYYLSTYGRPFVAAAPFAAVCWYIAHMVVPGSFFTFFVCMTLAMPAYLLPMWFIALTPSERTAARDYVQHWVGRRRVAEATS